MSTVEVEGKRSAAGSLLGFFALTYVVTWTCFIAAVALSGNRPPGAHPGPGIQALVLLGTFAPSLVALGLTARAEGEAGLRHLWTVLSVYLLQVTALSVAIAWLYWRTNGSLLLPMLMHAATNNTTDVVSSIGRTPTNPITWSTSPMGWPTTALLWIAAACFLVRMRRAELIARSTDGESADAF